MLRAHANGETFVSVTMCPQQCVLVCQGLYCRVFTASPFLDQSERETHGDGVREESGASRSPSIFVGPHRLIEALESSGS